MKVLTKPYGEMEIEEAQLVSFPRGLFGFEELRGLRPAGCRPAAILLASVPGARRGGIRADRSAFLPSRLYSGRGPC